MTAESTGLRAELTAEADPIFGSHGRSSNIACRARAGPESST